MATRDPKAQAVYAISVAAELTGTGQQNLRLYERKGLLEPRRTDGGTRRYSENDLVTLQRITELLAQGLNLTGIRLVLALETENTALKNQLRHAHSRAGTRKPARARPDTNTTSPPSP
ncbi:MerR family transcriptional regulator [Arthrobacter sp. A2-55]|uniref:MerR family transcriptional regulator n=1 Tax=Arthrobacter sp. A2-55 TaxID=2897337 RepID=UPI0021CDA7DE|nr:MerR family transcriptional regulator [Arthrobacter sp. A2-55]MCU6482152.1 MerR family transcriptional regulator [Arthrobacter sp. A2-55]